MGKLKLYISLLWIGVMLTCHSAKANDGNQYTFLRVGASDGLVNNQVTCLFKDSRGFVWIGTSSGLSRFDGVDFVNYTHDDEDSTSIKDNFIESLQEDKDGNLWIKTRWGYTIFNFNKGIFINDISVYLNKKGITKAISEVYIDVNKQMWLMPQGANRYYIFDSAKVQLIDPFISVVNKGIGVADFVHDGKAYYYIYNNGMIECFDGDDFRHIYYTEYLKDKYNANNSGAQLFVDEEKDLWVYGNNDGIYHYQNSNKQWFHYTVNPGEVRLSSNLIMSIAQDDKGLIWVGTDHGGIDILNKYSKQVQTIYHQAEDHKSLSQNSITDILIDNNNVVWIGTFKKGICYYHESIHKFPYYHHVVSDKSSLPFNDVNCFVEDKKGNLWIGTNGGGLIYFDRQGNSYKTYKHDPENSNSLRNNVIVSLFLDKDGLLWIGTYTGGLNTFGGDKFTTYTTSSGVGLPNDIIWTITQDEKNRIWIGTLGSGIVLFDKQKNIFEQVPNQSSVQLPSGFVTQIYRMRNGKMFIGTAVGIVFYDVEESRYRYHPTENISHQIAISNNNVNAVYEDSRGLLWVASREGLTLIDPYSDFTKIFRKEDGLPQDIINCIQEDEYQSIWVSKSSGLSQIVVNSLKPGNDYEFSIYNYTEADGLQGQEFNVNASFKTSNGEMIFGGPNGFNLFKTRDIKYNKNLPVVVFTDFQIFNKSVKVGEKINNRIILSESIVTTKNIELKHSMNVFSIEFAALNSLISEKVKYKYILEGFDKEWTQVDGSSRKVVYTNLDAGTYFFKVKACNNDGLWNDEYTQLEIRILPPFYASPLAFIIYIVLAVLIVLYFRYNMLRKARMKFKIEQERILARRNHELDEMKLRFLTNVSHEFRTPLTLILTPLDRLKKIEEDGSKQKLLNTVERNANHLLDLVNQLLDFRKLDLHGLKFNPSYGDIVSFLHEVYNSFAESFQKKGVGFEFKSKLKHIYFEFDSKKLQKVMMNLISNALKFTPEGGMVKISLKLSTKTDRENIIIKVKDTGIGIKEEEREKIFERFYQSQNNVSLGISGSGIGLNLAKEMVALHSGTIKVESKEGKGAEFIITLPLEIKEEVTKRLSFNKMAKGESVELEERIEQGNGKPSILLIEDNLDFRNFMKESLEEEYVIYEASDGVEGFEVVHNKIPDLIISDIMMPRMDGMEMCRKLKEDIRTSHIPIVLLTARTADEDKLKGLEIGADDYITKPFNMDLLLLRVQNLLEKQKKVQGQFQKNIDISPSEVDITTIDEKLIKKAIGLVEKNIAEPKFSVEDLSRELGMSRVYLYKKLLAITGKTPIEFIRIIRLKRGAQLLEKSQMNVAEVAYAVGFNSPRYFSKYFKEEFGILPKIYIKKYGKNTDSKIDIN